ncbi:carbohydrate sulfotransferase 1-like [Littorina saxatilis]|uniref:carbohydrate sulfotransferase 1-like n=1 Tax=Littorina saxatilis TaxID=31220 RepID=UPI0038B59247
MASQEKGRMQHINPYLDVSTGTSGVNARPMSESSDRTLDTQGPMSTLPQYTEANKSSIDPEVKLILLTYMRSGSTFTGELFNHHPRVFYFYEPLHSMDFFFQRRKTPALFFHRDSMKYVADDKKQQNFLMTNVITSTLNCDFEHMYTGPLEDALTFRKSRTVQEFKQCKNDNSGLQGLFSCLPVLRKTCTSAKITCVKAVRLPMELAATLLKDDPKVKVIHLVRDPRGLLNSRQKSGIARLYRQTPREFCDYVTKDLKDSIPLKKQYPGRVLTARYEDLAQQPLAFSAQLLTFARLDMEAAVKEFIKKATAYNDSHVIEKRYGTVRTNSSHTAAAWRQSVQFKFVQDVDKGCRELYKLVGYLPFANQKQLGNMEEPYYTDYKLAPIKLWSD